MDIIQYLVKGNIVPCQMFAHHTQLSLIAGCCSCSFLSQPPLLSLKPEKYHSFNLLSQGFLGTRWNYWDGPIQSMYTFEQSYNNLAWLSLKLGNIGAVTKLRFTRWKIWTRLATSLWFPHLALSSSILSPSLLLWSNLAVAASSSKLRATALLSASNLLPTWTKDILYLF